MVLAARDEKARRGAQIPLPADLAAAMRLYLSERRSRLVGHSSDSITAFPGTLDNALVFDVPEKMSKIFHADCAAAKIPKKDGADRVIDVHALRHTFGTMLAKAGVSLQVAQRAMRHSTPTLTANVYTHLGLLDVAGAVGKLPSIGATMDRQQEAANSVTPTVTPNSDIRWGNESFSGNVQAVKGVRKTADTDRVLANKDRAFQSGARSDNGGRYRIRT